MINLLDLNLKELQEFVKELGEPAFRAKQIFDWLYKGVSEFKEMKNIPESLQNKLEERCEISTLEIESVQKSKSDGTRKYLFRLGDGNFVESVFMKYKYGNSICLSTQAGCRMGCKFCASTQNGLSRNLTPGEIIGQILKAEKDTGEKISRIVLMGTGEPFDNYENVSAFINLVNCKEGLAIGMRNITVSTCGIVPIIEKFAEDFPQVNLAISLHGASNEVRSSMMPINNKYQLEELIEACKGYALKTRRRVTFEYTLVNGVNDSKEDAKSLANLLHGMLAHVNLIPLNKVEGSGFDTVSRAKAGEFCEFLTKHGIPATVRRELGSDIDAACGQLRLRKNKK